MFSWLVSDTFNLTDHTASSQDVRTKLRQVYVELRRMDMECDGRLTGELQSCGGCWSLTVQAYRQQALACVVAATADLLLLYLSTIRWFTCGGSRMQPLIYL